MSNLSVIIEQAEREPRTKIDLTSVLKPATRLIGDIAWGELAALNIAIDTINQGAGELDSEEEWERLIAGLALIELAAGALRRCAREQLRRFEQRLEHELPSLASLDALGAVAREITQRYPISCEAPGPHGCGDCDGCRSWGDEQYDARGDR